MASKHGQKDLSKVKSIGIKTYDTLVARKGGRPSKLEPGKKNRAIYRQSLDVRSAKRKARGKAAAFRHALLEGDFEYHPPDKLTIDDKQRMAIAMLTDFHTRYPDRHIRGLLGIGAETLNGWRNDPVFQRLLDIELTKKKNVMRLEAYRGWFRAIRQGDTKVIEKYFKMTGDLTEELNIKIGDLADMDENELAQEIQSMEKALADKPDRPGKHKRRDKS